MTIAKMFSEEGLSLRLRKGRVTVDCQGQTARTLDLSKLIDLCNRVVLYAIENPTVENGSKTYVSRKGRKHTYAKVLEIKTNKGWESVATFIDCNSKYVPYNLTEFNEWLNSRVSELDMPKVKDYRVVNRVLHNTNSELDQ